MNVLILCAGRGTRIRPIIGDQPKATIKFGKFSLLQRILAELVPIKSISQIYVNVSDGAREIVQELDLVSTFPKVQILYEIVPWGPSFTVFEVLKLSNNGLLVVHGDLLLESGSLSKFVSDSKLSLDDKSVVAVHDRNLSSVTQIIEVNTLGIVESIIWKKSSPSVFILKENTHCASVLVDSGIYFFSLSSRKVLRNPGFEVGVSEGLLPQLIENNLLRAVPWKGLRFAIDTGEKLEIAKTFFGMYPENFKMTKF